MLIRVAASVPELYTTGKQKEPYRLPSDGMETLDAIRRKFLK